MKSLEEREAYRAKQRTAELKEAKASPNIIKPEGAEDDDEGSEGNTFNASQYLNGKAGAVTGGLKDLSDDDLSAVEKAETSGKKRTAVIDAITTEKNRRAASSSGWSGNAG